MAGLNPNLSGDVVDEISKEELRDCFIANIREAAQLAQKANLKVNLEPLKNVDHPGYFRNYQEDAVEFIDEINEENVRLQFDCYHCQMMQGDIVSTFKKVQPYVEYVQIAGVPGRHEPDVGELNYNYILSELAAAGYSGFIGCEYIPKNATLDGFDWKKAFTN
jgi:hydroxypyruvate isomerase